MCPYHVRVIKFQKMTYLCRIVSISRIRIRAYIRNEKERVWNYSFHNFHDFFYNFFLSIPSTSTIYNLRLWPRCLAKKYIIEHLPNTSVNRKEYNKKKYTWEIRDWFNNSSSLTYTGLNPLGTLRLARSKSAKSIYQLTM